MNPNIRPGTACSLLKKLDQTAKEREDRMNVLQKFFSMLQSQGKGRVIRGGDASQIVYQRDVIYTSNIAESALQLASKGQGDVAQSIDKLEETQPSIFVTSAGVMSPQLTGKIPRQNLQSNQQSTEDFMMMIGNPITGDNYSLKNGFLRPHSQQHDGLSRSGIQNKTFKSAQFEDNQENNGDFRNELFHEIPDKPSKSQLVSKRGKSFKYELCKSSDERPCSDNSVQLRPQGGKSGRRLVNINEIGNSGGRHLRQTQQFSSFVESSKAPLMQPLLQMTEQQLLQNMRNDVINKGQRDEMVGGGDNMINQFNDNSSYNQQPLSNQFENDQLPLVNQDLFDNVIYPQQTNKIKSGLLSPSQKLQSVKVQEYKIQLDSPKEHKSEGRMRPGSTLSRRDESCNSSGGGGKFSNSHIKQYFQSKGTPNVQSKSLKRPGQLKSAGRLKNEHIYKRKISGRLASANSKVSSENLNLRTLNLDAIKKDGAGSRQTMNGVLVHNSKFYDTPYFGGKDSYDQTNFNHEELLTKIQSARVSTQNQIEETIREDVSVEQVSTTKSVLISKQHVAEQEIKIPSLPENLPSISIIQETPVEAALLTDEALLEHIIEETCESLDSVGMVDSLHTMKSNFNQVHAPQIMNQKMTSKTTNDMAKIAQHQNSFIKQEPMLMSDINAYAPLSERVAIGRMQSELLPVSKERRVVSPLDLEKLRNNNRRERPQMKTEDPQLKQLDDYMLKINEHQEQRDGVSARSLSPITRTNQNFDNLMSEHENENLQINLQKTGQPTRVISKIGGVKATLQSIPLVAMQGADRAQRQRGDHLQLTADPTKATFQVVSSQGKFEALPRYEELDSQISHRNVSKPGDYRVTDKPHMRLLSDNTLSPGGKHRIDMPSTDQNTLVGSAKNQSKMNFFNSNSQVVVKYSHYDVKTNLSKFNDPRRRRSNKDQGLSTDDHINAKSNRGTNYLSHHIVQILTDQPSEILATEVENKTSIHQIIAASKLAKDDPKQKQMLRRNMSVYRRANQKLKQLREVTQRQSTVRPSKSQGARRVSMNIKSGGLLSSQAFDIQDPKQQQFFLDEYTNTQLADNRPHTHQQSYQFDYSHQMSIEAGQYEFPSKYQFNHHQYGQYEQRPDSQLAIRHEDSSTVNQDSIQYPQHSRQQHFKTPKIDGAVGLSIQSAVNSLQSTSHNQMQSASGTLQIEGHAKASIQVSDINQFRLSNELGVKPLTSDRNQRIVSMIIPQTKNEESKIDMQKRAEFSIRPESQQSHPVPYPMNQLQPVLSNASHNQIIHSSIANNPLHRKAKSNIGFYGSSRLGNSTATSNAFGRCVTAANSSEMRHSALDTRKHSPNGSVPSSQQGSRQQLRRSSDVTNRINQLSGLLMIQSTRQILPALTAGGGSSPRQGGISIQRPGSQALKTNSRKMHQI